MKTNRILAKLPDVLPLIEDVYKDVHSHPELSMKENRTSDLVARHLEEFGYEVIKGIGKTGVVGILRSGNGPTVMLRADMDALPIQELTGLKYSSLTPGVAHACGHVCMLPGSSVLLDYFLTLMAGVEH